MELLQEPKVPEPDVSVPLYHHYRHVAFPNFMFFKVNILMPSLSTIRHILERLKSLDHHVTLAANGNGELQLTVTTDSVDMTTYYRHLINPAISMSVLLSVNNHAALLYMTLFLSV
jgi:hypothetical protein